MLAFTRFAGEPDYTKAIKIDPRDAESYVDRGAAYSKARHYDLAIADYSRTLEMDPDNSRAWGNLGAAQHHLGQYEQARRDYRKALSLDNDRAYVWCNLGLLDATEGNWPAARKEYATGLRKSDRRMIDSSIEHVQEALKKHPKVAALKQTLRFLQDAAAKVPPGANVAPFE